MAIQLYCQECRSYAKVTAKKCQKCGAEFPREGRKYRVDVSVKGKRVYRFCDNLTIAKEVEGTIRGDLVRGEYDIANHKVQKVVTLNDVWEQYLPWIKAHHKTWDDDQFHYHKHLEPRFGKKPLGEITPFDIEKMKIELSRDLNKNGKPYAAQSIKHYLALIRRLFKAAVKWGLHQGPNPMDQVKMPKVDNERTDFLTDEEVKRLMTTLETWPCRESAAFVKLALFT